MMNWKGCGRKRSSANDDIPTLVWKENHEKHNIPTEVRTDYSQNIGLECYRIATIFGLRFNIYLYLYVSLELFTTFYVIIAVRFIVSV
jgi:hypothetical protein